MLYCCTDEYDLPTTPYPWYSSTAVRRTEKNTHKSMSTSLGPREPAIASWRCCILVRHIEEESVHYFINDYDFASAAVGKQSHAVGSQMYSSLLWTLAITSTTERALLDK